MVNDQTCDPDKIRSLVQGMSRVGIDEYSALNAVKEEAHRLGLDLNPEEVTEAARQLLMDRKTAPTLVAVKDLQEGDMVDLEGDLIADPRRTDPILSSLFQTVEELEQETHGCICVYFENFVCGFPPDHKVKLVSRAS